MKNILFSFLVIAVVLISCKNYDDEFDTLNESVAALQSQVSSISTLQSSLTDLQNTVASLQSTLDDSSLDLSSLLANIISLQADLDALISDFSDADLVEIKETLANLQADLNELLESHNVADLTLNLTGLNELGDDFVYEGWIIVNGSPISTGTFSSVTFPQSFAVNIDDLEAASKFVLTIEPAIDSDPTPAATKILAGDFSSDTATLGTGPIVMAGESFDDSWGKFFLRTPTDESGTNNGNDESGIWFGIPGTMPPAAGFGLPILNAGWKYEAWVVIDGVGPISTGTFSEFDTQDDSNIFSGTLNNAGPPIPGEDYFNNEPDGFTFPLDLRGRTVVISVEPSPDNSPGPFSIKPLVGMSGQDIAPTTYDLTYSAMSFPSGTVIR